MIFTDPNATPLQFPGGVVGIKSFSAQIVGEDGSPTLLSEVYLHHWLVFDGLGNRGVCGGYLSYQFGVGAESRKTKTEFPEGYALVTTGEERWGANIHVLRTTNVPDVQSCIECHCAQGGGGFQCCPDGSFCPTGSNPSPTRTYYLEYTIEWTEDVSGVSPVDIYVLDASGCQIEYNVPQCRAQPCINLATQQITLPDDTDVVLMMGHLHVGGLNLTVTARDPQTGITSDLCKATSIMGTGDEPGNEKGYVVGMTVCSWDTPLHLPRGTVVTYTGYYSSDPYHDSVMSLVYLATKRKEGSMGLRYAIGDSVVKGKGHSAVTLAVIGVACAAAAVALAAGIIMLVKSQRGAGEATAPYAALR